VNAVLLVGGFGTRLRPLTEWRPKALLPIANRPYLEIMVDHLRGQGVTRVVMSCGHLADAIRDHFGDGRGAGVQVDYAIEDEPLGTGGAIAFAARGIEETFIACNGDVLGELDVRSLVDHHRSHAAAGTIALTSVDDPSRYGVVVTDDDGAVQAFVEKPPPGTVAADTINAGTYVLEPHVLELVPPGRMVSVEREVFPQLVGRGLHAVPGHGSWRDIGTPESYLAANLEHMDDGGSIDPTAVVAAGARVHGSVLGPAASVETGADVSGSVLLDGARVGENAVVAACVVGPGREVPAGAQHTGGIVW
jgi:NDP-sugar pyrophosphorylase family protein